MADTQEGALNWTDVYFKGQEEFMRRWSEMAGKATQNASATASPFGAPGAQQWFSMFSPQFNGPAGDLARRYFGFHDPFLAATRGFWEVLTRSMVNPDPAARARAFTEGLQALQQPLTQAWSQSAGLFGWPGVKLPDAGADFMQSFGKTLTAGVELPALGLTRERQESMQRLQKLSTEFVQQQGQLVQLWGGVVSDALKLLGERVAAKLQAGDIPESAKALYDLWIEAAESVFAKVAHTPAYAKAQADLGNTVAKLRTEQRIAIEAMTRQYDLPTRDELNTVHRRLKDLKAELRAVTARLAEAEQAQGATGRTDKAPVKAPAEPLMKAATRKRKAK